MESSESNSSDCEIKTSRSADGDLLKKICQIVRLKKTNSEMFRDLLLSLRKVYGSYRKIAKVLAISWGSFQNIYMNRKRMKKVYQRKVTKEMKEAIVNFCLEGPATIVLPEAEHSRKVFLNTSLKEACKLFNEGGFINRRISPSRFRKYIPRKVVKLQRNIPLNSCLCEICTNFTLLAQALSGAGLTCVPGNCRKAVYETLCPFEHLADDPDEEKKLIGRFGFRKCIFRQCSECGIGKLKSKIAASNESELSENKCVQWHVWETVTKVMKKGNIVKPVKRVEKVAKSGSLEDLFDWYLDAVGGLASHLFFSRWQYFQMLEFRANLQHGQILCSHDFAKNISLQNQNEVAGAYFDHSLTSLHCSVAFYRCCVEGCTAVVRHEIIHLSPILRHNASAFKKFHCDTVGIVERMVKGNMSLIVNVTDNAPSQYKNRNSFLFTSEYHKKLIHLFLGNRHGKGPSDQASSRFLLALRQAVVCDRVQINCARDVFNFAKKEYATVVDSGSCQHFRVEANFVTRIPQSKGTRSTTVDEIRALHAIKNTGIPGVIMKRTIGCLCPSCIDGDCPCKNPEYFSAWTLECVSKRKSLTGFDLQNSINNDDDDGGDLWEEGDYSLNNTNDDRYSVLFQESANDVPTTPVVLNSNKTTEKIPRQHNSNVRITRKQTTKAAAKEKATENSESSVHSPSANTNVRVTRNRTAKASAKEKATENSESSVHSPSANTNVRITRKQTTKASAKEKATENSESSVHSPAANTNVRITCKQTTKASAKEKATENSDTSVHSPAANTNVRISRSQMVKGSKRKRDPVISVKKCSKRNNKNGKIESQGYGYGSSVCDSEFMGSLAADLPRVSGKLCMWVDVLKLMSKLTSYKDLVAFCANLEFPPLPEKFSGRIIEGIDFVDRISAGLMHHCDVPFHCVPLQTVADGNCFCRALSKFVFNTEAQHGQESANDVPTTPVVLNSNKTTEKIPRQHNSNVRITRKQTTKAAAKEKATENSESSVHSPSANTNVRVTRNRTAKASAKEKATENSEFCS